MTDTTCPKCGDEEIVRCRACMASWECDGCGATSEEAHKHQVETLGKLIDDQRAAIAALTARAEKAEALAQYRLEAIRVRDEAAAKSTLGSCGYCGWDVCMESCPTITHPAEASNANT